MFPKCFVFMKHFQSVSNFVAFQKCFGNIKKLYTFYVNLNMFKRILFMTVGSGGGGAPTPKGGTNILFN